VVAGARRARSFAFLDLKTALFEAAREAWPRGQYLCWRDDTHWSGPGHVVAARAVALRNRQ
jgi:hypothetical protein